MLAFLPVLERDLRVRARGKAAYWLRVGVALAGLLVCLPPLLAANPGSPGSETGGQIFDAVVAAAFVICCGACLLSADAIGTERRDGTLDLLMLTRVRGLDLLLGKLGASALAGLCAVVAFVPVLTIPVLAGGVPAGEALRKSAALLNTLFLALSVGLYSSSRSRERFNASLLALSITGGIVVFPWLLWMFRSEILGVGPSAGIWSVGSLGSFLSPLVMLALAKDSEFQSSPESLYAAIGVQHLMAWGLLAWAGFRLRCTVRGPGDGSAPALDTRANQQQTRRAWFGTMPGRDAPIEWLVRAQPGVRKLLWLAAGVVIGFLAFFWTAFNWIGLDLSGTAFWLIYAVCSGGTDAMMAVVAGQFFHNSKRAGQLESLVTTPVGARDIVTGQWRALKDLLSWPVAVTISVILIHSTFFLTNSFAPQGMAVASSPGWSIARFAGTWIFDIAVTISGILAMCRLGMWLALRVQSRITIALWGASLGTGVPALMRLISSALIQPLYRTPWADSWVVTNWIDELAVLLYYLWLIGFAKARLGRQTCSMASTSEPFFHWRFFRQVPPPRS
jgi:ABC-type transport system involved in multi-copper enzyme maturation permease subunit